MKPSELRGRMASAGLEVSDIAGIAYDPLGDQWSLSPDLDVNYMTVARRPARPVA